MESFRAEIARLTAKHFSLGRIKEKTTTLAREMERLLSDAPGDTRRALLATYPILPRESAASISLDTTSWKVMSAASAAMGSREVSVIPGEVLHSSTNGLPSASRMRSTRLTSRQSSELCTSHATSAAALAASGVMRAGAKKCPGEAY